MFDFTVGEEMEKLRTSIKRMLGKKENRIVIFQLILMVIICYLYARDTIGNHVEFNPINGVFQNYNPVRRFLAGQIPYRDFVDYLGFGHLYSGAIVTFLFGNTFRASLVAFTFLALFSECVILLVINLCIFKRKSLAVALTNVYALLIIIQPKAFLDTLTINEDIQYALLSSLGTGTSARHLRGLILPLSVLLLKLGLNIIKKYESDNNKMLFSTSIVFGIVGGVAFLWSNDYGISCFVCMILMCFWYLYTKNRDIRKALYGMILEILISGITVLLWGFVLSFGHLFKWIQFTVGTGEYQSWYYNSFEEKNCYIFGLDFSTIMLIQAGVCLVYLYLVYKNKGNETKQLRYGALAYVNMVAFCADSEYYLLSGGSLVEVALSVLFATIIGELIYQIGLLIKDKKEIVLLIASVVGIAYCGHQASNIFIKNYVIDENGIKIDELDGWLSRYGEDILEAKDFLGESKFFSTYASAQEVACGTFQPAGVDYIIHVLGDDLRDEYLEAFREDDFDYAVTMGEHGVGDWGYSEWEVWVKRANWFFYRELLKNWHPVYSNTYETYWQRNDEENVINFDGDIEIEMLNAGEALVKVYTSDKISGTAEVCLDYEIGTADRILSKFVFREMLYAENHTNQTGKPFFEGNNLPGKGKQMIPITIKNGYGELRLQGVPSSCAVLNIDDVSVECIYPVEFQYLYVKDVTENIGLACLQIPKRGNEKVMDIKPQYIEINDGLYTIAIVDENDMDYYVTLLDITKTEVESALSEHKNVMKVR